MSGYCKCRGCAQRVHDEDYCRYCDPYDEDCLHGRSEDDDDDRQREEEARQEHEDEEYLRNI